MLKPTPSKSVLCSFASWLIAGLEVLFVGRLKQFKALQSIVLFIAVIASAASLTTLIVPVSASAATSSTINFQARLETAAGAVASDGNYNVEFKLYDASSSSGSSQGSCSGDAHCLWTETRTGANQVHVVNGYLTVSLGSVTAFGTINWNQQLWLTMNIGGTGGSPSWDGEMSPRLQLTAVPYALQAGELGNGTNRATFDASGNLQFQQASTVKELSAATGTALTIQGGAATSGTNVGGNLLLQGGAGASTGASGSVIVKANTNDSTTAFVVQNASGASLLTADTTNAALVLGNDATPSALTVRGGVATGTNVAGTNITFDASNGTGTGGSGDLIFQTAAPSVSTPTDDGNDTTGSISSNTSLTFSHIVANNPDRVLVVGVATGCGFASSCAATVSSVTYGGVNLTKLNTKDCTSGAGHCHIEFWYLASPVVGTANVVVATSASTNINSGASSYYNVDPVVPFGTSATAAAANNPSTLSVTSNTTQLVVDVITSDNVINSPSAGQTQRYNVSPSGLPVASSTQPGAASTTNMGWSDASANYATVGVAMNPPASTSSDTLQDRLHITAAGKVGISNANPQYALDVTGSGHFSGSILSPALDTANSVALNIGNTNASSISLGNTTSNILTTISGTALIKPTSGHDSTTAFQVQNAFSANILNEDTTATANLVTNGDFEASDGTTGWAAKGAGPTLTQVTTQQWQGNGSLQVATNTTANTGAQYAYTLTASTQYTLSLYAKVSSGSITDVNIGRQDVSGTDIYCLTAQTLTTSWTRFSCTFTTGGTITSSNLFIMKTGASSETFFVDGVQLQTGATASAFNPGGSLQLTGVINSPVAIQNKSDSTTAFQVQNAAGSTVLGVDTLNSKVTVGGNLIVNAGSGFSGNLIDLQVNATSEFTVNQSGTITKYNMPYKMQAYQGAAQTLANLTTTKVTFDTSVYDSNSNFNTSTSTYTAPVSGYYLVITNVRFAANAVGERIVSIYKNGSEYSGITQQTDTGGGLQTGVTISNVIPLSANDTVTVEAKQSSGGNLALVAGSNLTYLTIQFLSY